MIDIQRNILLGPYMHFKIGGPASYFAEPKSVEELREVLEWAQSLSLPFLIIGAGSNTLISDKGFGGLVVRCHLQELTLSGDRITVGASVAMARVVRECVRYGLTGFEWAIGVPGTIGGSVRGNAGCYGGEMKDVVKSVEVMEMGDAGVRTFTMTNAQCEFAYRHSIFKERSEWVVLSATLELAYGDPIAVQERVLDSAKKRSQTQDVGAQSAGCMFKNPPTGDGAGALIDKAGLKGLRVGGAKVSEIHGNFMINTGQATASDVRELVKKVQGEVEKKFGVKLEEEVQFVGFDT